MGRGHWRGVERWNGEVGSKGVNSLLPQPGPCYPGLAAHCGASDWVQMGSHLRQLPRFQVRQIDARKWNDIYIDSTSMTQSTYLCFLSL